MSATTMPMAAMVVMTDTVGPTAQRRHTRWVTSGVHRAEVDDHVIGPTPSNRRT